MTALLAVSIFQAQFYCFLQPHKQRAEERGQCPTPKHGTRRQWGAEDVPCQVGMDSEQKAPYYAYIYFFKQQKTTGCRGEVERGGDKKRESPEDWARGILCVEYPNKSCLTREMRWGNLKPSWDSPAVQVLRLKAHLTHPNPELPQSSSQWPPSNISIRVAPCHRPLFSSDLRLLLLLEAPPSPACPGGPQQLLLLKITEWISYQLGKKLYFNSQATTVAAFWGQDKQIRDL